MKTKLFFLYAFVLLFTVLANAQNMQNKSSPVTKIRSLTKAALDSIGADPYQFFPLHEGDFWDYVRDQYYQQRGVFRDSMLVNRRKLIYMGKDEYPSYPSWMVDTNYAIISLPQTSPIKYYQLDADSGEIWWTYEDHEPYGGYGKVEDVFYGTYLGRETIFKPKSVNREKALMTVNRKKEI